MIEYAISISSFESHKLKDIKLVLTCPTVRKLVFPATLPTAPQTEAHLAIVENYNESVVPQEFYRESFVSVPLFGENGIEFNGTIYFAEKPITPNVVNFKFTSDCLQKGIITLDILKSIMTEAIPVFGADDAIVYDTYSIKIPRPDGGYGFEQSKYYDAPDKRSYYRLGLEWITYYSPKLLELIGRGRFDNLNTPAEKIELNGGILVVLQREPFDRKNSDHVARKKQAEAELKLDELIEK